MNFGRNKFIYFLVMISITTIYLSYQKIPKYSTQLINSLELRNHRFIAHAGGGIDNFKYTNSLNAVSASINNGYKLIEIDLQETKDGTFVGVHDWDSFKKKTNYKGNNKNNLKLEEIKKLKIKKKFNPITIKEINKIFLDNKSLFFITDKTNNFKKIKKDFKFDENRILVEIFGKDNFKKAIKENIKNPILNYNKGDYNFIVRNNIRIISASFKDILNEKKIFKKLIKKDIFVFAYSSNEEKLIKNNIDKLFTHIYTDFWNIKKMICTSPKKLCQGLPSEFYEYMCYCKTLEYKEKPNYKYSYGFQNWFYSAKKETISTRKNLGLYELTPFAKFEVKGNFLGYIRFKRELSKSNKMLNFEKELIKLEKAGTSGIVVTGELTIVGLTDEFL